MFLFCTMFDHKQIHMYTWEQKKGKSRGGRTTFRTRHLDEREILRTRIMGDTTKVLCEWTLAAGCKVFKC